MAKFNALQIAQIVNIGLGAFVALKSKPVEDGSTPKKVSKADIKSYILATTQTAEAVGNLVVLDRKGFDRAISKMVDSVEEMLKKSQWN